MQRKSWGTDLSRSEQNENQPIGENQQQVLKITAWETAKTFSPFSDFKTKKARSSWKTSKENEDDDDRYSDLVVFFNYLWFSVISLLGSQSTPPPPLSLRAFQLHETPATPKKHEVSANGTENADVSGEKWRRLESTSERELDDSGFESWESARSDLRVSGSQQKNEKIYYFEEEGKMLQRKTRNDRGREKNGERGRLVLPWRRRQIFICVVLRAVEIWNGSRWPLDLTLVFVLRHVRDIYMICHYWTLYKDIFILSNH